MPLNQAGKCKAGFRLRTTVLNLFRRVIQSDHMKRKVAGIYRVKQERQVICYLQNIEELVAEE